MSVVICTHNRSAYLVQAVESVLRQDLPPEQWELIVVDNASRDDTPVVLRRFGLAVRVAFEPTLGLSHARNTGWRASRGLIVALLDDDAIAEPDWLRRLLGAFELAVPSPSCVGGRVLPRWETAPPEWLSERLRWSLSLTDWSESAHPVTDLGREWLVGANIAFQRTVLEELGGFPTALGRVGGRLLSGEEIVLQRRLLAGGLTCWYEPSATVSHCIPASRLTHQWFRRRQFAQGVSDGIIWRMERRAPQEGAWGRAVQEIGPLLRAAVVLPSFLRANKRDERFEHMCGMLWRLGFLRGMIGR